MAMRLKCHMMGNRSPATIEGRAQTKPKTDNVDARGFGRHFNRFGRHFNQGPSTKPSSR
jgi:hypothetical protein